MAAPERVAFIRNIAEVRWAGISQSFWRGAVKASGDAETAGSHHLDYRISMYGRWPMSRATSRVQEQVYHVLEGRG